MTQRDTDDAFQAERDRLSRRRFIQAMGGAGLALGGLEILLNQVSTAEAQSVGAQYLVVLTLDACRFDYLNLASMPHLQALIKSGTLYDQAWVGQLASETPTGHATIGTGVFPSKHGILGFEWRDEKTQKEVFDGWPNGVKQGFLDRDLKEANTNSVTQTVKAADGAATVVAVSSEKVYAADAMAGWAADYILYNWHNHKRHALMPQNLRGHKAIPKGMLSAHDLTGHYPVWHFTDWDYLSSVVAVTAIKDLHPRVLMVNFPGADVYGHPYGGPSSPKIMGTLMKGIDRGIGRIVSAYKRQGIFDRTLFLIVGDHGMVPNTHTVSARQVEDAIAKGGGEQLFQTGGSAKYVYLKDPSKSAAVAAEVADIPGIIAAYYQTESNGTYSYVRAGSNALDPNLETAHQYLLSTFAGVRAPDVVGAFRENTIGRTIKTLYGYHGGLNWGALHIPLILSGPGVRPGLTSHLPARLVDIAPTVLTLMGLTPASMDGVVLADALLNPTEADTAAQNAVSPQLTAYQQALTQQSLANIAEDNAQGNHPPPQAPVHPYWVNTCCGHGAADAAPDESV